MFLQTAYSEAGPVTSMEALACETPVFSTNTGRVAEILNKYNRGILVPPYNYEEWTQQLKKFLKGKEIPILERNVAIKYFSWPSIAEKFVNIYKQF